MRYTTTLFLLTTLALGCATPAADGATVPAAEPDPVPETIEAPPESTPEAVPLPSVNLPGLVWPEYERPTTLKEPNSYRVLALTADSQRLIFTSDEAVFEHDHNQPAPLMGTLHVMDLKTRAVTTIDTRVAIGIEGGLGIRWSEDAHTIVYGRIDESWDGKDYTETWITKVQLDLHTWRDGKRTYVGPVNSQIKLSSDGSRLVVRPWEASKDLHIHNLITGDVTDLGRKHRYFPGVNDDWVVFQDKQPRGEVAAMNLLSGATRTLALDGRLAEVEDGMVVFGDDSKQLVVHDLEADESFESDLVAPNYVAFFAIDREQNIGALGDGQGVYGKLKVWDLTSGVGYTIPMPEPRVPGGSTLASSVRIHAYGMEFEHRSGWMNDDLWDMRDDTATLLVTDHCSSRVLPDSKLRLLAANLKGCATSSPNQLYLYDEETLEVTNTGREAKYLRGVMSGPRVLYDADDEGGRLLTLWDLATDETTELVLNSNFHSAIRRAGTWAFIPHNGNQELLVIHPGGMVNHAPNAVIKQLVATDEIVVMVQSEGGADTLVIGDYETLAPTN